MLQRLLDKELQVSHMAPCILYMPRVTVRILTRDYEMCLQVEACVIWSSGDTTVPIVSSDRLHYILSTIFQYPTHHRGYAIVELAASHH